MRKEQLIKVNLPGGIVSPGDLHTLLILAAGNGVQQVRFGNRQQLLFTVQDDRLGELQKGLHAAEIVFETDENECPNICSSYVTGEIFHSSSWLGEGVYKDILNSFGHRPQLKINIVDYYQNLIPFFTGNLNFISSEISNFWYLYVRFPKTNTMYSWPSLVYSEDIAGLSEAVERYVFTDRSAFYGNDRADGELLYRKVTSTGNFMYQPYDRVMMHTDFQLPYYEGFNRYGDAKLWLGIYRRREEYPVDFLIGICELCLKTRVGQLYSTAWKSIVIKNIMLHDRKYWSNLLNKFRINVRHAANELNWQLEDWCEEAIALKLQLVRKFEEADQRTYPLCFAIKTKDQTGLFGSVVIRKQKAADKLGNTLFEISYTRNFNPNSKDFIICHQDVPARRLPGHLLALCDHYYQSKPAELPADAPAPEAESSRQQGLIYQCQHCLSQYDEAFGDVSNGILPGTLFSELESYRCPLCDEPQSEFICLESRWND